MEKQQHETAPTPIFITEKEDLQKTPHNRPHPRLINKQTVATPENKRKTTGEDINNAEQTKLFYDMIPQV